MSAPPYEPGTPAPSAHPDPDPTRHLNAPPYPLDTQPGGRPPWESNAAGHQNPQQPTVSHNDASDNQGINHLGGTNTSSAVPNQLQSTYDSSAGGYHAQGQVSNSLNIDPALLAMGQGARQIPTQQFNMHPGSQVTFAGNAFQHSYGGNAFQQSLITQGNQNMRIEGLESPANDADQMDEGAPMFDELSDIFSDNNTFISRYDFTPAVPAYPLDSFDDKINEFLDNKINDSLGLMLPPPLPNKALGLMLPPPLPAKALAHNAGNNNYVVFAQQGDGHPTAYPNISGPELVNSGEGYSFGGTSAIQESSGDSRSSASPTKKRRRSSSNDGSRNVSMEDLHKPQRPTAPRKRGRMSQSSASSAPFSSSESQASSHMSRRESLLAADDSDFKVASRPLHRMSADEAAEMCIKRVSLNINGVDNFNEVKAQRDNWIHAILQAFDSPYNNAPKTKKIDHEEFQGWQKEHHALTTEQLRWDPTDKLAEAIATHLYNQVVSSHEKGSLVKSSGNSFKHDDELKCKERLEKIIKALTGLTIIRFDLVTGARVHELVANPDAVFKRKEENKLENDRKKVKKEAADAAKATKATDQKPSALTAKNIKAQTDNMTKGGNKRGGQSKAAVVEESSSGSDDHSSDEVLASSSRNVFASAPEPKPVNNARVNNDEESSSGSDDHSSDEELAPSTRNAFTSAPEPKPVDEESTSGSDC
jgi:hypothetical protein